MHSEHASPTIIRFTSEGRALTFQQELAVSGEIADLVAGRYWLSHSNCDRNGPLILFLGSTPFSAADQGRILGKTAGRYWCVVADSHGGRDLRAAPDRSRRFFFWSRQLAEIAAWVRQARQQSSCDPTIQEAAYTREFARLNLIGRSPSFLAVLESIGRIAQTVAPVLIEGPTGSGKELAARAIHYLGPRQDRPFVPINCGAIPENLLASELFGHERGTFTDAKQTRTGLIDQASGGTLFLDEINSLNRLGQVTLLRFLQDQSYQPLGSRVAKQGNVRIIAATNGDLPELVARGEFRQDLVFRLAVLHVVMPHLADRQGDAALLADHFLAKMSARYGQPAKTLSVATRQALDRHSWPGNVRELENFIHRAFVLTEGSEIDFPNVEALRPRCTRADVFGSGEGPRTTLRQAKAETIAAFEKTYLSRLMLDAGGCVTRAAQLAGTERRALGKLLKKHGITRSP